MRNTYDIDAPISKGVPPLHIAAAQGPVEVVSYLIQCGANVNARTDRGAPVLWFAKQRPEDATSRNRTAPAEKSNILPQRRAHQLPLESGGAPAGRSAGRRAARRRRPGARSRAHAPRTLPRRTSTPGEAQRPPAMSSRIVNPPLRVSMSGRIPHGSAGRSTADTCRCATRPGRCHSPQILVARSRPTSPRCMVAPFVQSEVA